MSVFVFEDILLKHYDIFSKDLGLQLDIKINKQLFVV